jgi:AAA+ ATPase superfamily predicted ATPase
MRLARGFPIIAITGPRQSGKTTLARSAFPDKAYLSLEDPDVRLMAETDPRGLLSRFPDGAVLDEGNGTRVGPSKVADFPTERLSGVVFIKLKMPILPWKWTC